MKHERFNIISAFVLFQSQTWSILILFFKKTVVHARTMRVKYELITWINIIDKNGSVENTLSDQINVHFMSICGHKEKREW